MKTFNSKALAMVVISASLLSFDAVSQSVVKMGSGSLASEPPTYSLIQGADGGWNSQSTIMLSRKIYADELPSTSDGNFMVPGRPIPTNDWWTDIINNRFSGALWSYPAMVNTSASGVEVCWPSYWADAGKELKSKSSVLISGVDFEADATIAEDWHDWDVTFRQPAKNGNAIVRTTLAHGIPFSWFEFSELTPTLSFKSRAVDTAVETQYPANTKPILLISDKGKAAVKFGDDIYGFYFPDNSELNIDDKYDYRLSENTPWLVVALLQSADELNAYEKYAVSKPLSTTVSWNYDESSAKVNTEWKVEAVNLRDENAATSLLQGFLPHVYKHALAGANLKFIDKSYRTPRGEMKLAEADNGTFAYSYQFSGMLPAYAAPHTDNSAVNGFDQSIMNQLMQSYAEEGSFGGDTYWGGKGLTQMALNMSFAKQTGNVEAYELSKSRLKEALVNWLTYTPGEDNYYFSYFRRWGGILGFAVSYGSDTFNDHHFHYGYFTYAAALLCMEDKEFAQQYGEILTLLAKDYANWDRTDNRFPLFRTLDPWCGHSWAGGLGDAGNDNGNGQESTSESMQAWGGIYLLGVALNNKDMRDAGLFGWNTEARATREYWYDVDAPRSANSGGRQPWAGKNEKLGNYDYNLYPYAYNSNITGKGIGWWTWFGGDPLYMHGIQWMPISPALDYLSWDTDFVNWAYNDMMTGANSAFSHEWFEETINSDSGESIQPLADNDWGNVTLAYLQRCNPQLAADIFVQAWNENRHIAKSISTSHISYYTIHNTLTYGVPDRNYYANIPTATVFSNNGVQTFMAYNPGLEDLNVVFYNLNGTVAKTVTVAPGALTAFDKGDPVASEIEASLSDGNICAPNSKSMLSIRVLDQYGATLKDAVAVISLTENAPASVSGNMLEINSNAKIGTKFMVNFVCGDASAELEVTVNEKPIADKVWISGLDPAGGDELLTVEIGTTLEMSLMFTDQYANENIVDNADWFYVTTLGEVGNISSNFTPTSPGVYTIKAEKGELVAQKSVFITPSLPLISSSAVAISSSEQNVGTPTPNVNDGDISSRWGSVESDDEWIYLDLGKDNFISRVGILWEAAYAAEYELQVAPSGCEMSKHVGSYQGVENMVELPSEKSWNVVVPQSLSAHTNSEVITSINAYGRYVRMKGVRRATPYGYSIYEMNVYGIDSNISPESLLGIDFALPQVIDEGESIELKPVAYSRAGNVVDNVFLTWSANMDAKFVGNTFTPLSHGKYIITATTSDGLTAAGSIFVNESVKLKSMRLDPVEASMPVGDVINFSVSALDQFSAEYPFSDDELSVSVLDAQGKQTNAALFDVKRMSFTSDVAGKYTLRFKIGNVSADAIVIVKAVNESNLALRKPASASSYNGESLPSLAVDGNSQTRWESNHGLDGQWIELDLLEPFNITNFIVNWEAAMAAAYHIEASVDGSFWRTIYTNPNNSSLLNKIELPIEEPARYLRLVCDRRATDYGVSIWEWEVFGSSRFVDNGNHSAPEIADFSIKTGNASILINSSVLCSSGVASVNLKLYSSDSEPIYEKNMSLNNGETIKEKISNLIADSYRVVLTASDIFGNQTEKVAIANVSLIEGGANLALDKSAEASSEDGSMTAENVTDGDNNTRWKALSYDVDSDQWIVIDLGKNYRVFNFRLNWEGAYATDYQIQVAYDPISLSPSFVSSAPSDDRFFTVYHREAFVRDASNSWDVINVDPVLARYVRMKSNSLINNAWGSSLWEFQVWGDENVGDIDTGISSIVVNQNNDDAYYTLTGIKLSNETPSPGIYIRNGKKIVIR